MNILKTLEIFSPISLKEMDTVQLLNRQDSKFLLEAEKLEYVLNKIKSQYKVLEIKEKRFANYETLYFDTDTFFFYHQHHNGKLNRHKVRIRNYIDSKINFLEIKFKNNKGKTKKDRVKKATLEKNLSENSIKYLKQNFPEIKSDLLKPQLWVYYKRITLVNKNMSERLTIDLDLTFKSYKSETIIKLPKLAIAEVKQDKVLRGDNILDLFREEKIIASGFSKYCMGINLLYDNVKHNNFKKKTLFLNKIHGTNVRHTLSK